MSFDNYLFIFPTYRGVGLYSGILFANPPWGEQAIGTDLDSIHTHNYIFLFFLFLIILNIIIWTRRGIKRHRLHKKIKELINEEVAVTPDEFFAMRKQLMTTKSLVSNDIVGIYVLHNLSKDKYYVGQAKRVFFRVNQHFTGSGNGDVYADYKYGDAFTIRMVSLVNSGYQSIDKLEADAIATYHAYDAGYNRTRGNRH